MNLITDEGKYYLYRHIRLDKNEVSYVGIGTKAPTGKHFKTYRRAYSKYKRPLFWKRIFLKSNYEVEIILESDDYDFVKNKEKEFIALYGRINLGTGTLCNLTDGGEGTVGQVHTDETKEKIRQKAKGKIWDDQRKERFKNRKNKYWKKGCTISEESKKKMSQAKRLAFENGTMKNNCKRGSSHRSAKLNEEQVLEIVQLLKTNISNIAIASMFNVSPDSISSIYHGRTWKHLTGIEIRSKNERRKTKI